jgi:hypothetical protein
MNEEKECTNCHVLNYKIGFISKPATGGLGHCDYYINQKDKSKCDGRRLYILEQQLQTAKEENEKLKETTRIRLTNIRGDEGFNNVSFDIPKHFFSNAKIIEENTTLTQQNKHLEVSFADCQKQLLKMREALKEILLDCEWLKDENQCKDIGCELYDDGHCAYLKIKQALGGE